MLPPALTPDDVMELALTVCSVQVPVCRPRFTAYTAPTGTDRFGGKDLLLVDGRPQFAEVAILRLFEVAGWEGRWVETYQRGVMDPAFLREWNGGAFKTQMQVPIEKAWVIDRLRAIAAANGNSYSGCWDVVAWKGNRLVFAESKKAKHDRMRGTQLRWLEAAMKCGCAVEDFQIVEWALA